MKKKILSIALLILLLAVIVSGCRESALSETAASAESQTESLPAVTETAAANLPDTQTDEPPAAEPASRPSLEERFSEVEVELLAEAVVPYDESAINGYFAYSEDYDTATILTLGLRFPDWDSAYNCGTITVIGETATEADDKPVPQTSTGASWRSTQTDKPYYIIVQRVAGEVDPSKAAVRIKESWGGGASAEVPILNNGESIGFADAKVIFPESVKTLQGRTYFIVRRYWSSYSASGDSLTDTVSFVLVPLEGGLGKTLDPDSMKLYTPDDIRAISGALLVNVNGAIDGSTVNKQSTIELAITRELYEERDEDGHYPDEVLKQVNEEMNSFADRSYVEIDDGSGNMEILHFGD